MPTQTNSLDATFAALSDPTRRAIVARLATGDATVAELAAPFEISAPAITRHLRVLRQAGLIEQRREAQWRPCHLKPERLREVSDWVSQYRAHWEGTFDHLDDYLRQIQED